MAALADAAHNRGTGGSRCRRERHKAGQTPVQQSRETIGCQSRWLQHRWQGMAMTSQPAGAVDVRTFVLAQMLFERLVDDPDALQSPYGNELQQSLNNWLVHQMDHH
ncbi:hypothetical protein EVJ50_10955 [Synechococcus sp. RSCCF101]|nr:hypothetical protein EVJ50_10955 [Synechococcus sp. RSCCF101]